MVMTSYILRRLSQMIFVLFCVTAISFGSVFIAGDPVVLLLGETNNLSEEDVNLFRHQMGFDRPIVVQYFEWLGKAISGDFGVSLKYRQSNFSLIMERLPATIELTVISIIISLIISLPLGITAALKQNTLFDTAILVITAFLQSIPRFLIGIVMIFTFSVYIHLFPASGRGTWQYLILPITTICLFSTARSINVIRSSILDITSADYVRTAKSKGLAVSYIIWRHVLPNTLIPVISLISLEINNLIGGSIIIESVFAWPGIGRLMLQAIQVKDFPLIQTGVVFLAIMTTVINLLADIAYTIIDPRVWLQRSKS